MAAPRVNPHERVVCDPGEQPTSRSTCFRAATCARALELAISWLVQFWSLRNGLSGGTDCDHPLPCSQGPGLCYHCAVVWNTEPAPGPKSMSRIPTIRPCLLEAGLLHVSFWIQSSVSNCPRVTKSHRFNEDLWNAKAKASFSSSFKSFNYALILTFFGFSKWGGVFCVCMGAEAGTRSGFLGWLWSGNVCLDSFWVAKRTGEWWPLTAKQTVRDGERVGLGCPGCPSPAFACSCRVPVRVSCCQQSGSLKEARIHKFTWIFSILE